MAYGQTGAGKTYTLSSTKKDHLGTFSSIMDPRGALKHITPIRNNAKGSWGSLCYCESGYGQHLPGLNVVLADIHGNGEVSHGFGSVSPSRAESSLLWGLRQLQDLLKPSNSNMQIRESENGVYVSGIEEVLLFPAPPLPTRKVCAQCPTLCLCQIEVGSQEDCLKLLTVGEKNRTVAFTRMVGALHSSMPPSGLPAVCEAPASPGLAVLPRMHTPPEVTP